MITTTAGSFEADSPFLRRPSIKGVGSIAATQSRDARTIVVQPLSAARVRLTPRFLNRPSP